MKFALQLLVIVSIIAVLMAGGKKHPNKHRFHKLQSKVQSQTSMQALLQSLATTRTGARFIASMGLLTKQSFKVNTVLKADGCKVVLGRSDSENQKMVDINLARHSETAPTTPEAIKRTQKGIRIPAQFQEDVNYENIDFYQVKNCQFQQATGADSTFRDFSFSFQYQRYKPWNGEAVDPKQPVQPYFVDVEIGFENQKLEATDALDYMNNLASQCQTRQNEVNIMVQTIKNQADDFMEKKRIMDDTNHQNVIKQIDKQIKRLERYIESQKQAYARLRNKYLRFQEQKTPKDTQLQQLMNEITTLTTSGSAKTLSDGIRAAELAKNTATDAVNNKEDAEKARIYRKYREKINLLLTQIQNLRIQESGEISDSDKRVQDKQREHQQTYDEEVTRLNNAQQDAQRQLAAKQQQLSEVQQQIDDLNHKIRSTITKKRNTARSIHTLKKEKVVKQAEKVTVGEDAEQKQAELDNQQQEFLNAQDVIKAQLEANFPQIKEINQVAKEELLKNLSFSLAYYNNIALNYEPGESEESQYIENYWRQLTTVSEE